MAACTAMTLKDRKPDPSEALPARCKEGHLSREEGDIRREVLEPAKLLTCSCHRSAISSTAKLHAVETLLGKLVRCRWSSAQQPRLQVLPHLRSDTDPDHPAPACLEPHQRARAARRRC